METFITELPNTLIGWLSLLVAFGLSVTTAILLYRKFKNGESDRLIGLLQGTVEELEKKVNKQDEDIKLLSKKVETLQSTNETLTAVLQGRDKSTMEFQQQVLVAVTKTAEMHVLIEDMYKQIGRLVDTVSAHIVAMESSKPVDGAAR